MALDTIGQRLRWARRYADLSQEELGIIIGIGTTSVSHRECGNRKLSQYDLVRITKAWPWLNLRWLLTGEGERLASQSNDDTEKNKP